MNRKGFLFTIELFLVAILIITTILIINTDFVEKQETLRIPTKTINALYFKNYSELEQSSSKHCTKIIDYKDNMFIEKSVCEEIK